MTKEKQIGRSGEDAASAWLQKEGFRILERNWRHGRYEIDIIAEKNGRIHIVEVKCRLKNGLTLPEDAYTNSKFSSLFKAAEAYIEQGNINADTHFDLIAVRHGNGDYNVEYIPDAMVPEW